jgi:hypothetical protein
LSAIREERPALDFSQNPDRVKPGSNDIVVNDESKTLLRQALKPNTGCIKSGGEKSDISSQELKTRVETDEEK